tara:strand:- start:79 stop:1527 length:1449 start_codon:yes stop_codon:yes gene_type:complete
MILRLVFFSLFVSVVCGQGAKRPNVLMIFVDDLRPALGCYGDPLAKTPNIDRFARTARQFNRAYCNQAVCGPSRANILTGRLPDNTHVWHNRNLFRDVHPDLITLPQLFKNDGWHAVALGKVFSGNEKELDPASWSEPEILRREGWKNYLLRKGGGPKKGALFEKADVPDDGYTDGKLANLAIRRLASLKQRKQPFFLAVGFFKPHLPFNAPKKYWDWHDPKDFALAGTPSRARGAPDVAYPDQMELGGYQGVPKNEEVSNRQARELRRGYYACVSYVDTQVGRLLDGLESLRLNDNTIVLLLGDHGFSLGEAGHWCKKTNFELDTHVPLLMRSPDMKHPGAATKAMVEYTDLYPTLAELAGLNSPADLDGRSFANLLVDPDGRGRDVVLSQHSRPWSTGEPKIMGYSIRTEDHRYTRWIEWETRKAFSEELYDYRASASVAVQEKYLIEIANVEDEKRYAQRRNVMRERMDKVLRARVPVR